MKELDHNTNGKVEEEEVDSSNLRPADIEQDVREMERRKRVEAIMHSKLFREELERIVDGQLREGPPGLLQQLTDIVGLSGARGGLRGPNCFLPINDIRGIESIGYDKGEKILRCKLASTFRLLDLFGWYRNISGQITARLNADQELFLANPYGLLFSEITAASLNKVNMQGNIIEQGYTNFGIDTNHFALHSAVHAHRPDLRCIIFVEHQSVVAVSAMKVGVLPLNPDACKLGEIAVHSLDGSIQEPEEKEKLIRGLGPNSKVLLLTNLGALCCGETIEEAFFNAYHLVHSCENQLKAMTVGLDNLILISEERRKSIYTDSRKPPTPAQDNKEKQQHAPKWRLGGAEFEAFMRMLDNAGYRTGHIYRSPLIKNESSKPKNDVELPPAVSSLGYLLEEEEFYKQGIWKKGEGSKRGERNKWLNSPNVYNKVEVLETGTNDPKKITKWVADGSPTHSNPVKIDGALQFVPTNTNPKEFKKIQQQIKDNRRADKISAGPQSHILEGVSWDEATKVKDANTSDIGEHVVLMGAASKGIIQRGYQHNATVYKAPYAKNPFDSVTDDEINEYKKTIERKQYGEGSDTEISASEALIVSEATHTLEGIREEPQIVTVGTVPKPSQPEVVLSDGENYQNGDNSETHLSTFSQSSKEDISTEGSPKKDKKKKRGLRTPSFLKKKKEKKKTEA